MNRLFGIVIVLGLINPATAPAQFSLPGGEIASYPFDNLPSSARCTGMGGACVALGGNLDTSVINPANLGEMDEFQISAQVRYSELDGLFLDQDALDSELHGPAAGQLFKIFKETGTELGYLGVGKSFGKWSVAAHYQNHLEFSGSFNDEEVWDVPNNQIFVNFNALQTSIESMGITASYTISDKWTAGLTVRNTTLDVESTDAWELKGIRGSTAPTTGFDSVIVASNIRGEDSQTLISVGLLYEPNPEFLYGFSWRQGGDFSLDSIQGAHNTLEGVTDSTLANKTAPLSMPDVLSLGATWRSSETMLFSLNLESISYSDLPPVRNRTLGYASAVEELIEPIDDGISVRLGFEKVFATQNDSNLLNDYTIRAGLFTEDDHDGMSTVDGYDTHFAIGFAVSIGRERRLRLDMGFEFGDEDKNYLVSLTY